jgi:RNA-directed DNA polymerase
VHLAEGGEGLDFLGFHHRWVRYGNSTVQFDQIIRHADRRLALLIAHRYEQPWRYGRKVLNSRPDRYGLITLNGTIAAPRPNRPWRQGR